MEKSSRILLERAMDRALMASEAAAAIVESREEIPDGLEISCLEVIHHVAAVQHILKAALEPSYASSAKFKKILEMLAYTAIDEEGKGKNV